MSSNQFNKRAQESKAYYPTSINSINVVKTNSYETNADIIINVSQTPEQEQEWAEGLQNYLYNVLLPLAETNPDFRIKLVEEEAMASWIVAFTHESYNPNMVENYEEFEKLGDSVMKTTFYRYLMSRFEYLNKMQISQLGNYYVSKPVQAELAKKFGLVDWLRSGSQIDTHMAEDILEALFGALLLIGDQVYPMGNGYVLSYNLLVNIYNSIEIDLIHARDPPKTEVKNIFDKLKFGSVIETWYESGYGNGTSGTYELLFPKSIHEFILTNFKVDISKRKYVLAVVEGNTKKIAGNNAYKDALKYLNIIGLTLEWVQEQNSESDYETAEEYKNSELRPSYEKALKKAKSKGFNLLYFNKTKKGSKGCYVQLIGEEKNGHKVILRSISACPAITSQIKQEMLLSYYTN